MLSEIKVNALIDKGLEERPDLFLIDLKIGADNKINVVIDGDQGVTVEDCIFISRAIEHNLDREEEDFSLDVSSAGATSPFVQQRQYRKNIGRLLGLKKTSGETLEATLVDADDEGAVLEWSVKEPKAVGKGKTIVTKQAKIKYEDILEAKVIIKF